MPPTKENTVSRIRDTFRSLHQRGECGLIVYLPVGFPTLGETYGLVQAVCDAGADLVELGVPFSDPLADGSTIQRATRAALDQGVTVTDCLSVIGRLRRGGLKSPVALMGYLNPFLAYGIDDLAHDAVACGVDGLIIPDLPPGVSMDWPAVVRGLDRIQFVAPTTRTERLDAIVSEATGFLYFLSVAGITGVRAGLPPGLGDLVRSVRAVTDLPIAVGFGIATQAQVCAVSRFADGVIVGSALIEVIERAPTDQRAEAAARFVASLKEATRPDAATAASFRGGPAPMSETETPAVNRDNGEAGLI
jgi:tryptophan synthase alpha chain